MCDFTVGDPLQLNELGQSRNPRKRVIYCKFVGYGATASQVRVLFEGARGPATMHASYLEFDQRDSTEASLSGNMRLQMLARPTALD